MEEELLSEYLDRGYSLIPLIQNSKFPAKKWERYQREKANKEEVQEWNTKGWNIGVVTGKISRLAVVDVDDKSILNELSKKFPEIKKTASVETPRGHHFYFECEYPLSPKYNFLDLPKVELKGDGCYVVAPQSVVGDKAYNWEIPLKYIVPLPSRIIEEQRQRIIVDLDILECPYYCGQDVLCIKQILNCNIEEGFRDLSFFVLYNLLLKKKNTPAYAQKIVRFKNKIIRKPLSEKELRKIFKGDYRKIGCSGVLERLPFIDCEGCKYLKKRFKQMEKRILLSHSKKFSEMSPSETKVVVAVDFIFQGEVPSVRKLAEITGMSKTTVQTALEGLRQKGIFDEKNNIY